jgi:hypothetical protein
MHLNKLKIGSSYGSRKDIFSGHDGFRKILLDKKKQNGLNQPGTI